VDGGLSQESDNDGWPLPEGTQAALRAAWECLARRRHGDWPIEGDPRLVSLPFRPSDIEWIEEIEGFSWHRLPLR